MAPSANVLDQAQHAAIFGLQCQYDNFNMLITQREAGRFQLTKFKEWLEA